MRFAPSKYWYRSQYIGPSTNRTGVSRTRLVTTTATASHVVGAATTFRARRIGSMACVRASMTVIGPPVAAANSSPVTRPPW